MGYIYRPCYGNGLLLNPREYRDFLRKYYRKNGLTEEKLAKSYAEYVGIQDIIQADYKKLAKEAADKFGYITSDFSGHDIVLDAKNKNLRFSIIAIKPTSSRPITFVPYRINGKTNEFYKHYYICQKRYLAFCDIDIDRRKFKCCGMYASYADLVKEFKKKFEKYLPDDFDWDSHIGKIEWVDKEEKKL